MASSSNSHPSKFNDPELVVLNDHNYLEWKKSRLDFINGQGLAGFIDGTAAVLRTNKRVPISNGGSDSDGTIAGEVENNEEYNSWERLNDFLWDGILKTLTEDTRQQVNQFKTAKEVWTQLETLFNPVQSLNFDKETEMQVRHYKALHDYAMNGDWKSANEFIEKEPDAVRHPITIWSETALLVAIRLVRRNHFAKKLLENMAPEDLAHAEFVGHTALHRAAALNNIEVTKLVVDKNPKLLIITDNSGVSTPLHLAAERGNREIVLYLIDAATQHEELKLFEDKSGAKLVYDLASSGLYDIALSLLERNPKLACMEEFSPLMAIIDRRFSFRSGTSLNFWQSLIYTNVPTKLENNVDHHSRGDIENPADCFMSGLVFVKKRLRAMFWDFAEKIVPHIKHMREMKLEHHQAMQFVKFICKEVAKSNFTKASMIFWPVIQRATFVGIDEIIEEIWHSCPSMIGLRNSKKQYIFQYSIVCRCENVFNHVYQLEESRWLLSLDTLGNNSLHLAGYLRPQQQLKLRVSAAGAALQMQRELQWFKEVEKFVLPGMKEDNNNDGRTPAEVFTDTHQELVKEGEKWLKDTANSCTIIAALIATVVFAAAITVPGGNNCNDGHPFFSKQQAFIIFGISDAFALFSSIASVLMFLSILTARYGEEDFLYALPKRLIIGLITLFVSILSTMIAFGSTLYLVFGDIKAWILIPIVALACVPVTLFAALQFPLLVDMIKSTYGPGIFGKQSNRRMLY